MSPVSKNMQDKSPPMSMNRKPDLRTLMPPSNKCNNMPTIVSVLTNVFVLFSFFQLNSLFSLLSRLLTDFSLCFNAALQCEDFDLMLVSHSLITGRHCQM